MSQLTHKRCTKPDCVHGGEIQEISNFVWDKSKNNYHAWCRQCKRKAAKDYRERNPRNKKQKLVRVEWQRTWRKNRQLRTIERFGSKCNECGYDEDVRALHIDHIRGDGSFDRKRFGSSYDTYITYLLSLSDEELNENYQCLCANCNWIKRYEEESYN